MPPHQVPPAEAPLVGAVISIALRLAARAAARAAADVDVLPHDAVERARRLGDRF